MNLPKELLYTKEHEWIRIEENIAIVGITDYAQNELGDIVFVELPEIDSLVDKDEAFGTIEAVKAVADLYSPLSGKVVNINANLEESPETVNNDPYGDGWMIKIEMSNDDESQDLLSDSDYYTLIK